MIFQPRSYQIECVSQTRYAWNEHRAVLNVLATGLGKSEIAAMLMGQQKRSLFLVHRDELVQQMARTLARRHHQEPDIEKAKLQHDPFGQADVVASIQSCQKQRLDRFQPQDFGTIVIDEAHHAVAPTYRKVLERFPHAKIVGFTATSNRTDEKALELVFERLDTPSGACFSMPIATGTNEGWLVPLMCEEIVVTGLDLTKIKMTKAGDFNRHDLDRAMAEEGVIHEIARPLLDKAQGKQGIVFCAGVDEAVKLTEVLQKLTGNKNTAAAIHCNTKNHQMKHADRRAFIKAYKHGDLQFLVNFGVLTEGFDAPMTAIVANARPTTSSLIVTQMLGRGTRPIVDLNGFVTAWERRAAIRDSAKPSCLVLDFKGKTAGAVKLASVEDALGGDYDDEVKEMARRLRGTGGVTATLELAAHDLEFMRMMAGDRSWFTPDVNYESKSVDLYGARHETSPDVTKHQPGRGAPATEKQIRYLWRLHKEAGIPWSEERARSWTKGQAGAIITRLLHKKSSNTAGTEKLF